VSYSLIEKENSSTIVGEVIALFISQKGASKRVPKSTLQLDKEGIFEDKFYAKDSQRSILITTVESYQLAKEQNIPLEYGSLGENIVIDYNPYMLPIGKEFQIGAVSLEITQKCTLCKSLTKVDNKLPKLLKDDRGVFAKVIKVGSIYKGDRVTI